MTLIKWNTKTPSLFNEIDSFLTRPTLFNEIDRFFNSVSTQFPIRYEQSSSWVPQFEVLNTEKAYSIRADLPGMIKKDINIEVVDNTLTISGERINDNKDSDYSNYSEMSYGKFTRSFNLPEDIQEDKIKASMKDGVLALQIPRIKPVKPKVKKISIK